jgi:hypothetical protein
MNNKRFYLAVDADGTEVKFSSKPKRFIREDDESWYSNSSFEELPQGPILSLMGKSLTWDNDPVLYVEEKVK